MDFLHHSKLSHRFAALIAIFVIGFTVYGVWSFKTLTDLKINGALYQRIIQGKDLVADVLPPPEYVIESYLVSLQMASATDKGEQDALVARLRALKGEYDTRHEFWLKEGLEGPLADALLKQADAPAKAFYALALDQLAPAVQKQDKEAVGPLLEQMRRHYETHRKAIDQVVAMATKRSADDEATAKARIDSALMMLLAIFLLSLGLGIGAAMTIIRSVVRGLGGEPSHVADISRVIAAGDLSASIQVRAGDSTSLLHDMKVMQETLAATVAGIRDATNSVSNEARQISAGNSSLSDRTAHQAGTLEETASSLEELTATLKANADKSDNANRLAMAASDVAQKGGQVVAEVVATMGSINESSRKIVDIIGVIDGIAFQTNILALNAAVEAARAGEQGRGFAVVASEVRSLAQRSASAAKEIKGLIGDSVEKVESGTKLVAEAGATMDQIVSGIRQVTVMMAEINQAILSETAGIDQISEAVLEIDSVTQQNAALAEEDAAAAESLHGHAATLAKMVSVFKLGSERLAPGTASPAPARRPAKRPARSAPATMRLAAVHSQKPAPASPKSNDGWEEF